MGSRVTRLLPALVVALVATACGGVSEIGVNTGPAAPLSAPLDGLDPDAESGGDGLYSWTMTVEGPFPDTDEMLRAENVATIQVDQVAETALITYDYTALGDQQGERPDSIEVAFVDGTQLVHGITEGMFFLAETDMEPDPDAWYIDQLFEGPGIPDLFGSDRSVAAVWSQMGVTAPDSGAVTILASQIRALAALDEPGLFGSLAQVDFGVYDDASVTLTADDHGRLSQAWVEVSSDSEPLTVVTIEVDHDGQSFEVPDPATGLDLGLSDGDEYEAVDDLSMPYSLDTVEPYNGVLLRLNSYLGSGDIASLARADIDVSLTPDGTLVWVGRTDVFAGPGDFRQWRLSEEGTNRLLAAVGENPVIASGAYNVRYRQGVTLDVGPPPSELNAHPENPASGTDYVADIEALIGLLGEPSWLGDDIIEGPSPWVPTTLTLVGDIETPSGQQLVWPLDRSIREMAVPGRGRHEGAWVVCLDGTDVAPVWALLGDGVNSAHIPLDDGESWDGHVYLNWPGYRLFGDPCAPDYERYLELLEGDAAAEANRFTVDVVPPED